MIELNLLPDIKKEYIRARQARATVVSLAILISIIAGAFVVLFAITVYVGQAQVIKGLQQDITKNQATLESKPEVDKYLAIQSQLNAVNDVTKDREIYSRVFDYFLALNPAAPNNVSLYGLELTKDGTSIVVRGSAKSFEAVNNFKSTLENANLNFTRDGTKAEEKLFTSITAGQPSLSNSGGKTDAVFEFTLTYNPIAFNPSYTDVTLSVPKLVTSDGDENAPKELFSASPATEGGQ